MSRHRLRDGFDMRFCKSEDLAPGKISDLPSSYSLFISFQFSDGSKTGNASFRKKMEGVKEAWYKFTKIFVADIGILRTSEVLTSSVQTRLRVNGADAVFPALHHLHDLLHTVGPSFACPAARNRGMTSFNCLSYTQLDMTTS